MTEPWMPRGDEMERDKGKYSVRHRKPLDEDEEEEWGSMTRCLFTFSLVATWFLLAGSLGLILYWALQIKDGFQWEGNDVEKQFNLHPVLMIAGFVFFSGHALLTYRFCRCCKRITSKLMHTFFHLCSIACVVVGALVAFRYHDGRNEPHLYSLHSWLGLITMGLFALQFVVGFFSFLLLMCCESRTAGFRASLVPLHATFGLTTFLMGLATALTGITQKLLFDLGRSRYNQILDTRTPGSQEGLVLNTLALVLASLAILVPFALRHRSFASKVAEGDLIDERL